VVAKQLEKVVLTAGEADKNRGDRTFATTFQNKWEKVAKVWMDNAFKGKKWRLSEGLRFHHQKNGISLIF